MVDIAKALARLAAYNTKYFGRELGAQSKFDDKTGTSLVNGVHDTAKLAGFLENFIKKYVHCYGCGNPETEIIITKTQMITMKCAACGFLSDIDMRDKLTTFVKSLVGSHQLVMDALFEALFDRTGKGFANQVAKKKNYITVVDTVYLSTPGKIAIIDHEKKRTLVLRKEGFPDAALWHPCDKKAKSLPDFGDEDYQVMLCLNYAAVENPITLKPSEEWMGCQELSSVLSSYFSG